MYTSFWRRAVCEELNSDFCHLRVPRGFDDSVCANRLYFKTIYNDETIFYENSPPPVKKPGSAQ